MNAPRAVSAPLLPVPRLFVVFACALALILVGCAEQRIRDESQHALTAGDYEQGLRVLEEGLREHPESTILRSRLLQARTDVATRLLTEAAGSRASGRVDDAQKLIDRAQALDPGNERVKALALALDTERRQQVALSEAEGWVTKKRPDLALRTIEQALKDNPRHSGLLDLQRKLELDQRQAQLRASQATLAETRPISLDFRDASLRTVLDVVSRNSGVNFVLDKDIRPDTRITVYLRQAKVEDALDLIVSTNQLAKKVLDAHTIVVYPNTPEKQRDYQDQIVRVFYLASAEAKGAALFLRSMLKIHEPFVDERSNMLALRDSPDNIRLAERLISLYDTAEPEVLLDVEVLEVSASRLTELGVKYPEAVTFTLNPPAGQSGLTLDNLRNVHRSQIGVSGLGATLNLRREVGDFNTLANPQIRVRNKEKAKIMVGDKIPVVTTTTGQSGFVSDSVNYLDVGLKLEVEPAVYADDEVAIKVGLEVSSLGSAVKTASGTLAYQIGTRNANTLLRLRDGETQLLAGLISRNDRTSASRIPGIGDLPVLGRLFSSQLDDNSRTELVLAVTPHVLRNIRRPDANEAELWVGTENNPRLLPPGGSAALATAESGSDPERSGGVSPSASPDTARPARGGEPKAGPIEEHPVVIRLNAPAQVKRNEPFELNVALTSGVGLRGMPLELQFSKDKLELVEAREAGFFKRDGTPTSFSKGSVDALGHVALGVLRNTATPATGDEAVVTLTFRPLTVGVAEVRLTKAMPIGLGEAVPLPALPPVKQIQIQ